MRGVLGETIIGFPSPDATTPAGALAVPGTVYERFRDDPLIVTAGCAARDLHQRPTKP